MSAKTKTQLFELAAKREIEAATKNGWEHVHISHINDRVETWLRERENACSIGVEFYRWMLKNKSNLSPGATLEDAFNCYYETLNKWS